MKRVLTLLAAAGMCGCAQNVEPVQQLDAKTRQAQPQDTHTKDIRMVFFNGPVADRVLAAVKNGDLQAVIDLTEEGALDDIDSTSAETSQISGKANATYAQVNFLVFKQLADSSQNGQASTDGAQTTTSDQTVKAAIELLVQAQAALQGTQGGSQGLGFEGGQGTGGAVSAELSQKIDVMIDMLKDLLKTTTRPAEQ